jgi:hypothetical protein
VTQPDRKTLHREYWGTLLPAGILGVCNLAVATAGARLDHLEGITDAE